MAEVTLHEYCEEAKELIRADSYDQAIAICRHILEYYPKHVTSYRLLGEACLEQGDYVEAANLLKRVLSVDLEDVIAYVGLGIVYDEQGALEEAIWQLERAFELTPGNTEIRGELQRLYSERDGITPRRLKLTPGALGRLYLKEELYQRAIDEFSGVLDEDPERVDIQIAMAEALWWSDQRQEAAEACEAILEELPNCLKANLILGEILLNSDREDEGRALLRNAQAVDPENTAAQELFRDQSPVPSESVYVRRLDKAELEREVEAISPEPPELEEEVLPSTVEAVLEEEMPDWLRKLREEEKRPADEKEEVERPPQAEEMPAWLRDLEQGVPGKPEGAVVREEESTRADEEDIPTWLRELEGVSKDRRPEEPSPYPLAEEEAAEPAEATMEDGEPDTPLEEALGEELSKAQDETLEAGEDTIARLRETMPDETASIEEIMAWMERSKGMIAEEEQPEEVVEDAAPAAHAVPDMGPELRAEGVGEEAIPPSGVRAEEIVPPSEVADEEPAERQEPIQEGMKPESPVVASSDEEFPTLDGEEVEISEEAMPDESASVEELVAWMDRSKATIADEEALSGVSEMDEEPSVPSAQEELPSWLQELRAEDAEEEAIRPLEELTLPSAEEELPFWLQDQNGEGIDYDAATPLEEVEALAAEREAPEAIEDLPSWLGELRAEDAEEEVADHPEEVEAPPAEVAAPLAEEEMPSWLRDLRAEAVEEKPAPPSEDIEALPEEVVVPVGEDGPPSWLVTLREEAREEEAAPPLMDAEALPEEVAAPPAADTPTWLAELRAEPVEEVATGSMGGDEIPPADAELPTPSSAETPTWLVDLRAERREKETAVPLEDVEAPLEELESPTAADIPNWLRELRAEATQEDTLAPMEESEAPDGRAATAVDSRIVAPGEDAAAPPPDEVVSIIAEEAIPASAVQEEVPEIVDVAGSVEGYVDHLASNPQDHQTRLALARTYSREGDLAQAGIHYGEIVSSGNLLEEVIDALETVADAAPDHLPTHELLADAYMRDGRLQKALDKYRWLRERLAD